MGQTALKGPIVAYGTRAPIGTGAAGSENPDLAPSLFWGSTSLLDPRIGYNVNRWGSIGLPCVGESAVINQVPSAIADNNIAAIQTPGAGVHTLTLVAATGAGITVLATALVVWSSGNTIASGALAIDGPPGIVAFGLASVSNGNTKVSIYDPTKTIARNVRITSGGNDSGITFTVAGADLYGYPMTETITGASAGIASGKKAFKFVTGVTSSADIATTVKVGTGDVYGFPLRSDFFGDAEILWNNTWITASTGYLAADTTNPATATTGDARGTYAVQSASDGTKRLFVYQNPPVANIGSVTGLFGITPA